MEQTAKENGIAFKAIHLESKEEAQNAPTRKISTGSSKEKAVAFVEFSDMANVMLCLKNTGQADIMLSLSKDTGHLTQEKSEER